MSPRILLAPAGHGKTHHCIARTREVQAAQPLAPVWAILPNRDQVRVFRRRLAEAGGAMGVHLGTFYTFYAEILARAGQPAPRLSDPVQHRLLRAIVDQLCDQGHLRHYAPLRRKPGFILALRALIQELKRARIFPDAFAGAVSGHGPRLAELVAIYAAYQDWLVRTNWADAEGQGWLAAIALDEHPDLCRDLRLLVVNGFDEFNPTQLGVLQGLASQSVETIITLTGDASAGGSTGRTRIAHRRFARAQVAVTTALDVSPSPLLPLSVSPLLPLSVSPPLPAPLAHFESALFEPSPRQIPAAGAVAFLEAPNRSEEVRAALRWLKARIVRDGMQPHEVAVLARDLAAYRPFLEETAAELGLPLRVATGTELEANPAVAALLSLLSLPARNWLRRAVLDAWRSPYFDWSAQGMAEGDADQLDAASHFGLVIEGVDQWTEALDRLAGMAPAGEAVAEDEEAAAPGVPAGTEAAALRRKFEAFVARLAPPEQGAMRDYVAFVEDLVGDDPRLATRFASPEDAVGAGSLGVVARAWDNAATAARDIAALRAFKDVLRGLVLAESVLEADPPLPSPEEKPNPGANSPLPPGGEGPGVRGGYANFIEELRSAVEGTRYEVPAVANGDSILAAPILRARGLSLRAVALLGLSEGEFPRAEREDTLLREADRAELRARGLPLEPRLQGDEPNLFYQALTRARERLLLCRPYLADDGQPWEPSPYWQQVQQLADAPTAHVRPEDPLPLEEVASPQELVMAAAGGFADHDSPDWRRVHTGAAVLRARLAERAAGPHEGDLSSLAPALAARFDALSGWSASRLESYGTCPLDFFVGYGLDLEPRRPPEVGFDVRTLGLMYHHILEEVHRRAADPTDLDELLALLPVVAQEEFDAAPQEYGFRPTPLWDHQRRELEDILRETLVKLAEASGGYTPRHFEPVFGFGEPPLVLRGDGGQQEVRFHGYIDRVDVGPDGRLRIVDYKAGGTPITARDLAEGRRLQLGLYALAARDALGLGEVAGGFYWHVGKAQASSLKLERFEGGVPAALDTAARYALAYVAAIRAGRYEPQPPPGGCPGYCPATAFCWRYAPQRW